MASRAAGATERERGSGLVALPDEDKINKDDEAMAWKLLSLAEVSIMLEQDIAGVEKSLEEFLNLKHRLTNLKEAALLDYYVSGFWWAKGLDFSSVQIGGFLTLLNLLLDNLETYHMTLEENIQELASAMAGIGLSNSEISSGFEFFTIDQAKAIINYVKSSLFQHYTLYEYLFHSPREELVTGDEKVVELVIPHRPPCLPPLEEGLPMTIYSNYVALTPGDEERRKRRRPRNQKAFLQKSQLKNKGLWIL
ncbi:ciliary-associated calcium-binding coiled-coil protein 1 [Crotalus tigris]|uniref:ciliary-associated calcium-binding coiled-coil protein 1 n=1 Tax=Crotalus tigris TaxID=88082 RepID=UPI00192F52F8|nr:ciliary-associated calcium-binding coiled-coil protein 1 [Crotalus tigris]XP_039215946.1 ciliary-associated calcium-binding coiled-coil protein 1 [Crotalus tigris]XP_039215947.1 ciliary-associated calcium-binding coiled-coil protein 1 [Crotalus tigris]